MDHSAPPHPPVLVVKTTWILIEAKKQRRRRKKGLNNFTFKLKSVIVIKIKVLYFTLNVHAIHYDVKQL